MNPVLLDTQLLLWAALQPERLPPKADKLLQLRETGLAFSVASLWEVAIKTSLGRPDFTVDAKVLRDWLLAEDFTELAIAPQHVIHVGTLPWHHRDPFDRLLVAQAAVQKTTLLTADRGLKVYGKFVQVV